jgi:cob(I)alamin adenosyltransferase
MTVNLTRIYTKLGDGGDTHLGDMSRVSKLHTARSTSSTP